MFRVVRPAPRSALRPASHTARPALGSAPRPAPPAGSLRLAPCAFRPVLRKPHLAARTLRPAVRTPRSAPRAPHNEPCALRATLRPVARHPRPAPRTLILEALCSTLCALRPASLTIVRTASPRQGPGFCPASPRPASFRLAPPRPATLVPPPPPPPPMHSPASHRPTPPRPTRPAPRFSTLFCSLCFASFRRPVPQPALRTSRLASSVALGPASHPAPRRALRFAPRPACRLLGAMSKPAPLPAPRLAFRRPFMSFRSSQRADWHAASAVFASSTMPRLASLRSPCHAPHSPIRFVRDALL